MHGSLSFFSVIYLDRNDSTRFISWSPALILIIFKPNFTWNSHPKFLIRFSVFDFGALMLQKCFTLYENKCLNFSVTFCLWLQIICNRNIGLRWKCPLWGVFLRDHIPYLCKVTHNSKKNSENSEQLGWRDRMNLNPAPLFYHLRGQNLSAVGQSSTFWI